jgi:hypothetical protein
MRSKDEEGKHRIGTLVGVSKYRYIQGADDKLGQFLSKDI